jgi:uncharacterized protein YqgC (DUF456 family)
VTAPVVLRSASRAAVVGAAVGALLGAFAPVPVWRPILVGAAAGLVPVIGLRLAVLARAEWRRQPPAARAYLGVALPLTVALLLVAMATS